MPENLKFLSVRKDLFEFNEIFFSMAIEIADSKLIGDLHLTVNLMSGCRLSWKTIKAWV